MSKHRIFVLLKYAVSAGLIALILTGADLSNFLTSLKELNVLLFGLGLLVVTLNMLVRSYKWYLLLKAQSINIPLLTVNKVNYMSLFFNNFFLGTLGGDAFRIYRAIGHQGSKGGAISSVVMERALGAFAALVMVLGIGVGLLFVSQDVLTIQLLVTFLVLGLGVGLGTLVFFKFQSRVAKFKVLRRVRIVEKVSTELTNSMEEYKSHPMTLTAAFGLSVLFHVGNGFKLYLFGLAVGAVLPLFPLLFISPLVALLGMIPISINGIGLQEGAYVFYLGQIGVAAHAALLIAVLSRASLLILSLVGGLLFLASDGKRKPAPRVAGRGQPLSQPADKLS